MKVSLEKKTLVDIVSIVSRAAARNPIIPVFGGLCIEAKDGQLQFTATDMEIGIRTATAEAEVLEPGAVIITAEYLSALAPKLVDGVITLETKDNKLEIKHGRNKARINILEGEWTGFPSEEQIHRFTLPQDTMKNGLSKVAFAAASKHFRSVFNGILLDIVDGVINFVASDTYRLAICSYPLEAENWSVIIPNRTVAELLRILNPEDGETITVSTIGNNLLFSWGDYEVSSATIGGEFPSYQDVIPAQESVTTSIKVDASILQSRINRLSVLPASKQQNLLLANLEINPEEIKIQASSDLVGTVRETCSAEVVGEPLSIAFNQRYLSDALNVMDKQVTLHFAGSLAPAIFQSWDNHKVILTPVRTHA